MEIFINGYVSCKSRHKTFLYGTLHKSKLQNSLIIFNFHRYLRIIYKKHRKLCGGEQINFFRPIYQSTTIYKTSLVLSTHYKIPDLDSLLG